MIANSVRRACVPVPALPFRASSTSRPCLRRRVARSRSRRSTRTRCGDPRRSGEGRDPAGVQGPCPPDTHRAVVDASTANSSSTRVRTSPTTPMSPSSPGSCVEGAGRRPHLRGGGCEFAAWSPVRANGARGAAPGQASQQGRRGRSPSSAVGLNPTGFTPTSRRRCRRPPCGPSSAEQAAWPGKAELPVVTVDPAVVEIPARPMS